MTDGIEIRGATVAIANRAEIAVRIAATCVRMGAIPVLLLGEPDLRGYAARRVGRVESVGEAGAELNVERVVAAAHRAGADFLHPGYGFLSERAELAAACEADGIRFVGPSAETLRLCGDKLETRAAAERAGVPVLPASQPLGEDSAAWLAEGERIGYPLLVKPAGAGGGRGLRFVEDAASLVDAVAASRREGATSSGDAVVYLERALIEPRHVEVQVVADGERVIVLGDRDCSLQRRHQKVIEEAPAPNVDDETRRTLHESATRLATAVGLRGVATCEFLLGAGGEIAFLEINPRIQVEHPVTELVTGVDLVEWQLRIASGERLAFDPAPITRGHAVEARIYAEEPAAGFRPAPGRLATVAWPDRPGVRVDAGYETGDVVPHAYDPMLAKVIAHGSDREAAIETLRLALLDTVVAGVSTNVAWLLDLLCGDAFRAGSATTQTAAGVTPTAPDRHIAAIVALAHMLDEAPTGVSGPWSTLGSWRLLGDVPITLHGSGWEARLEVRREASGWMIRDSETGTVARWSRGDEGVLALEIAGDVVRAAVVPEGGGIEVFTRGGRWTVRRGPLPTVAPGQREAASTGRVLAPMPGSVVEVHVVEGDRVERGQPLMTLTAMKMEIVCEAPVAGVVEEVTCRHGDLVAADRELVRLRPDDTEPALA